MSVLIGYSCSIAVMWCLFCVLIEYIRMYGDPREIRKMGSDLFVRFYKENIERKRLCISFIHLYLYYNRLMLY